VARIGHLIVSRSIVVVKVGGSLLDWPDLPTRLASYLESRRADRLVLVVGGGRFADVLRGLDAIHSIGEVRSHALSLRALDLSAHVLADLLPVSKVVEDFTQAADARALGRLPILAPRLFLGDDDRSSDPLPHAWMTTTDSIAARLAVRLDARELVLLKSTPLPPGVDRLEAARLGLVDEEFPRAAAGVPVVTFIHFRDRSSLPQVLE
jgi:5-(aminomethyl)-3-furanmethanol phosphate kinase